MSNLEKKRYLHALKFFAKLRRLIKKGYDVVINGELVDDIWLNHKGNIYVNYSEIFIKSSKIKYTLEHGAWQTIEYFNKGIVKRTKILKEVKCKI